MNVQYKRIITFPNDTIIDCVISNANNKKKVLRRLINHLNIKDFNISIYDRISNNSIGFYAKVNSHHYLLLSDSLKDTHTILHEVLHIFLHICDYSELSLKPSASEWSCYFYSELAMKVLKNNYNKTVI